MRKGLMVSVALGMALSLIGCGGAATKDEFGRADAGQISKMMKEFEAAYNAKDVEKIGTYFAGNASLMPANRSTLNGVDLNAHNLLVGAGNDIYVLDFDRGRIRARGAWERAVLARLRRSLLKVTADLPVGRFTDAHWRALLTGAGSG